MKYLIIFVTTWMVSSAVWATTQELKVRSVESQFGNRSQSMEKTSGITEQNKGVIAGKPLVTEHAAKQAAPSIVKKRADTLQENPDFWNTAMPTDCQVLKALDKLTFDTEADAIIEGYFKAVKRGGSPKELASVSEHLTFLKNALMQKKSACSGPATIKHLGKQVEALEKITNNLAGYHNH